MSIEPVADSPIVRRRRIDSMVSPTVPILLSVPNLRATKSAFAGSDADVVASPHLAVTSNDSVPAEVPAKDNIEFPPTAAPKLAEVAWSRTRWLRDWFSENAQKNLGNVAAVAAAVVVCAVIATAMQGSSSRDSQVASPPPAFPETSPVAQATDPAPPASEIAEVSPAEVDELFTDHPTWNADGANTEFLEVAPADHDLVGPLPEEQTAGAGEIRSSGADNGLTTTPDLHQETVSNSVFPPLSTQVPVDSYPQEGAHATLLGPEPPPSPVFPDQAGQDSVQREIFLNRAEGAAFGSGAAEQPMQPWQRNSPPESRPDIESNPILERGYGEESLRPHRAAPPAPAQQPVTSYPSTARSMYPSLAEVKERLQYQLNARRTPRVSSRATSPPNFSMDARRRTESSRQPISPNQGGVFR